MHNLASAVTDGHIVGTPRLMWNLQSLGGLVETPGGRNAVKAKLGGKGEWGCVGGGIYDLLTSGFFVIVVLFLQMRKLAGPACFQ